MRLTDFEPRRVDELAPATLASYKTKAGAAATAADAAGDRKTADRRFSGIVKATKKQFDQDAKGMSEGLDDTVRFEVDSENAYNHVMDQFGSVIDWDGDTMVAPRKYWGAIQELALAASGEASEEHGLAEGKLKINYDSWLSKVPNTINDKMKKVLRVMQDGKVRSRADMLRAAGIDPNPRSPGGVAGMEGTDYYLYKKGLLDVVDIVKGQKYFKISKNASQGMAEGSAADGSVNYTLGHTPDAEYVYSIYRDGKKEGTYHSVAQAREIMGNMKLTSPNREYKIKRGARNKMAGPASQLPEQGMAEGSKHNQQDLDNVADWMNTTPDKLSVEVKQEPIEKFIKQIREMYGTYDEFPKDEDRTNRILNLLKRGAKPLPIYVEAGDSHLFVMEGRHRMVAFWLAEMKTIPVAYVSINSQQGVAEGALDEDKGMTGYNAFKREWRAKHGSDAEVPGYDSKEYTSYVYRQNDKKQGVAEGVRTNAESVKALASLKADKIAKHNAAVAKLPGGQAHRSNHPNLLKSAPKGYSFSVSHKLVPDQQGVSEGSDRIAANKQDRLQALENKLKAKGYARTKDSDGGEYQYRWTRDGAPTYVVNYRSGANGYAEFWKEQDMAEAYNFKGSFPFDLDHMGGTRGINLPSAPAKKFFTDKKQWTQTVDDINSSKYDDNSEYSGTTGRTTVSIDDREWARWSDAQEKGYIEMSSMTESDVSEAIRLGSRVKMHAPGKDYHDQDGHVGEIRHGAFRGAPKTYTVDYGDGKSVQLGKGNLKHHVKDPWHATEPGMTEDDDAVAAFLARGGEIQQLKPQSGPKRSGVAFASKHIGSAGGRGNTKGKVSGLGANTGKASKPVVTAEQHMAEDALAGMKRLAGIAPAQTQTTPGQRQYRHMPTAVQPR